MPPQGPAQSEWLPLGVLELVAPGTPLREGIDRILSGHMGALLVLGWNREVEGVVTGGFKLGAKFTAQRLSELAKMDGAIVVDADLERFLYANVHLVPDHAVLTSESGTRHRTAERVARQTGVPVISVSESMRIVSLYVDGHKHVLEAISSILFRANQALSTLERSRTRLAEVTSTLSALEIEDVVTLRDVLAVLQRSEMVRRISTEIDRHVAQLGRDGRLLRLQLDELMQGVPDERDHVIRDYVPDRRRRLETVAGELDRLEAPELLDLDKLAAALGYGDDDEGLDRAVAPRGHRLLSRVPRLPEPVIDRLLTRFTSLPRLLDADIDELDAVEGIGEARARQIKETLTRLAESSILERYA